MSDALQAYLAACAARAERATKGPWGLGSRIDFRKTSPDWTAQHPDRELMEQYGPIGFCGLTGQGMVSSQWNGMAYMKPEDEDFLKHARTDLPTLLTMLQRAREEIEHEAAHSVDEATQVNTRHTLFELDRLAREATK